MEKFEDKHTWMLPVVDKQNRYLGFISKSRILNAYSEQLKKIQQKTGDNLRIFAAMPIITPHLPLKREAFPDDKPTAI